MPKQNLQVKLAEKIAKEAISAAINGEIINNEIIVGARYGGDIKYDKAQLLVNEITNHILSATITRRDNPGLYFDKADPRGELFHETFGPLIISLANFIKTFFNHKPGVLLPLMPHKSPSINHLSVELTIREMVTKEEFKSGLKKIMLDFLNSNANDQYDGAYRLSVPEIKTKECAIM